RGTIPRCEDAMHLETPIFLRLMDSACMRGIVPNPFVFGALRHAGASVIPRRCGKEEDTYGTLAHPSRQRTRHRATLAARRDACSALMRLLHLRSCVAWLRS